MDGIYRPGAFKNKSWAETLIEKKEEVIEKNEEVKEEPILLVNKKWVNFNEIKKVKESDINVVKYLRRDAYMNRVRYFNFMEEEREMLLDIYDRLLNYDDRFLDRLRILDDDRGFIEFSKFVFVYMSGLKK